jgi:hypothetical protein
MSAIRTFNVEAGMPTLNEAVRGGASANRNTR